MQRGETITASRATSVQWFAAFQPVKLRRMTWLIVSLQHYPEIALFLAVGAGFWIGNLKQNCQRAALPIG